MDVCGAPALTARVVADYVEPTVAVIGGGGKSGSLSLAAARQAGAGRLIGVVPHAKEAELLTGAGLADEVVIADARDPIALRDAVAEGRGTGRRDGGLCRRPRLRGRRDPVHGRARHGHLLLDGHVVLRRRPRAPRVSPPTSGCSSATATCPAMRRTPWSSSGATPASADSSRAGCEDHRQARPRHRADPRGAHAGATGRQADRQDRAATHHGQRRARHPASRRTQRRRLRGHALGQPARRRRARRRRARARPGAPGVGRTPPRRGRRPRDAGPEGVRRLGHLPPAGGQGGARGHEPPRTRRSARASSRSTAAASSANG